MGEGGQDEEVASSKKKLNCRLECKNRYPFYDQNGGKMAKIDTHLMTKTAGNHTLWGRTYLYSPSPPFLLSSPLDPHNMQICGNMIDHAYMMSRIYITPITMPEVTKAGI